MTVHSFRKVLGKFGALSAAKSAELSGVPEPRLAAVRVVEQGPVRTVIEAALGWNNSTIVLTYKLPAHGSEVEIDVRVYWNEKDRMLKLAVPTTDRKARYLGQVVYGTEEFAASGDEYAAQKWVAVVSDTRDSAVTLINSGTYGSDCAGGEIRLTLMRSPAYSAHPLPDRRVLPAGRFTPRIDQGERQFTFWLNAGPSAKRLRAVDREALVKNEKPFALSFTPPGSGSKPAQGALLADHSVLLTAMKKAARGGDVIVRLFEPTGKAVTTQLSLPTCGVKVRVKLGAHEIKTLRISPAKKTCKEVNLIEE
jgi:alpha-mannosidase